MYFVFVFSIVILSKFSTCNVDSQTPEEISPNFNPGELTILPIYFYTTAVYLRKSAFSIFNHARKFADFSSARVLRILDISGHFIFVYNTCITLHVRLNTYINRSFSSYIKWAYTCVRSLTLHKLIITRSMTPFYFQIRKNRTRFSFVLAKNIIRRHFPTSDKFEFNTIVYFTVSYLKCEFLENWFKYIYILHVMFSILTFYWCSLSD